MRHRSWLALPAVLFAALLGSAADEPAPLLKPVAPGAGSTRVRVPIEAGLPLTDSQFKAQVPQAKGKKGEVVDVTVTFDTLPGRSSVSAKKWKSWGYEVPANNIAVLPELIIPASQLAPKVSKGRDVAVKFTNISLEVVETPAASMDMLYGSDLYIRLNDLTKNADRAMEPRYYFGDKFFELTVPTAILKKLGTGDETPPEPAVTAEPALVVVSGPMAIRNAPVFAFASVNGFSQYKTPDGKEEIVNVAISSNTNWPGIIMTIGTARGCKVEMDNGKDATGTGTTFESMVGKGKVKELRLAFQTGPGLKVTKDLVLKDVTVFVDKNNSGHFVWLGTKFINENMKDGIYGCGPDGSWRLHGRVAPDLLQDIKTRVPAMPAKKP